MGEAKKYILHLFKELEMKTYVGNVIWTDA